MKNILLTTTALVAFAGAAAAGGHTSLTLSGGATLGYNNDIEDGFFWNTDIDISGSATLDNGITATASLGLEVIEDELGNADVDSESYVLTIGNDMATLSFGDLDPVAEDNFSDVDGGTTGGFFDQDVHFIAAGFDAMLVGEANLGGVTAMISYGVDTSNGDLVAGVDTVDAMQVYVSGTFGMFDVQGAYQGAVGTAVTTTVMGVAASTSFAGADVSLSYMDDETSTSMGVGVSYPLGAVTVGGYYSVNNSDTVPGNDQNNYGVSADYADGPFAVSAFYDVTGVVVGDEGTEFGVEGSYEVMSGMTVLAGYIVTTPAGGVETAATYVAGTYDLGGGAEILVSYAEDEANAINDEIGDPEYNHGTTVQVSFSF